MSLHFISGLPRSGSTLLSALLMQNPRFHAGISSPVNMIFTSMQRALSGANEAVSFVDDGQRERLLRGVFEAYYHELLDHKVVFDTGRIWCSKLHVLLKLFPQSKV